ncbi:hypothetical protein, partial [Dysosmobacter sp.]|uniref:hypothetical protein n=1 Tax=Dysosmobacter sp. TaxID=2591382 RepID=UPI002A8FDCE6
INTYLSIITLNVNVLNAPTKRLRVADWIKNKSLHPVKNWSGAAHAAPLRLKLNIFLPGAFFVLSVQSGAVQALAPAGAFFIR